jgi:hypothetical protein
MSQKSQELQLDQQLDLMRRLFEQQSQAVRLTQLPIAHRNPLILFVSVP